jgi:hypothetical protein
MLFVDALVQYRKSILNDEGRIVKGAARESMGKAKGKVQKAK